MGRSGFRVEGVNDLRNEIELSRLENADIRNNARKYFFARLSLFLRVVEIECQLYRGDEKYPREMAMTMRKMGAKNKELVASYIKSLDNGESKRLWSWKIKNLDEFNRIKREFTYAGKKQQSELGLNV